MNTVRNLGELLRARFERPQPATWLNRSWRYQSAATHDDASAFRARMQEYARLARRPALRTLIEFWPERKD